MTRLGWLAAIAVFLTSFAAAQTPAGSRIVHQARATVGGTVVPSNQVVTVIAAVCRARVSPESPLASPVQAFLTKPLATTIVPFRLTNDGNDTFEFLLATVTEGDWRPEAVRFHLDQDENGRLDPRDAQIDRHELAARDTQAFLMVVVAPDASTGDLWITPRGECPPGVLPPVGDATDGYAKIGLRGPESPIVNTAIALGDAVAPADAEGGARRIDVRVEATNDGGDANDEVVVEVPLEGDAASCFTLQGAASDDGQVDVLMGGAAWWPIHTTTWRALSSGGDRARAVRLRLARLVGGEVAELLLQFDLLEEECGTDLPSIGTRAQVGDDVTTNVGFAEVRPRLIASLTPVARDDAPAGAPARLLVGQPTCFPFELRNAGNAEDVYRFALASSLSASERSSVELSLRNAVGLASEPVLALAAGEAARLSVCAVADALVPPFDVAISVLSDRGGRPVSGRARIDSVATPDSLVLVLDASPRGAVPAGASVAYTVRVENGLAFTLSDLAMRIELAAFDRDGARLTNAFTVDPASLEGFASDASGGALLWRAGELEPAFGRDGAFALTLAPDLPDDVRVVASLAASARELSTLVTAPALTHLVWSSSVLVDVRTVPALVRPGDRFDVRVDVFNGSASPVRAAALVAELPAAVPLPDLDGVSPSDGAGPLIPPGGRGTLLLPHRLLAQAVGSVEGLLTVDVRTEGGLEVVRDERPFTVRVDGGAFRRDVGVLIGHVFDAADRRPLAGVRVLLPDGRSTISDERGRFAFPDTPAGPLRVLFDPATLQGVIGDAPERLSDHAMRVVIGTLARVDVPVIVEARAEATPREPASAPEGVTDPLAAPLESDPSRTVRIVAPAADARFAADDAVTVIVEGPSGVPFEVSVAGTPLAADRLGAVLDDPQVGRRREAYYAVDLAAGANEVIVRAGESEARQIVYRAGPPVRIDFVPIALVADGVAPIEIVVRLHDEVGIPSGEGPLDVDASTPPLDPDAFPERPGHQALLRGGEARLRFPPRVGTAPFEVRVAFDGVERLERFAIAAPPRTLWTAQGGVGVTFPTDGSPVAAAGDARLYLEHTGPVGSLELALDLRATLTDAGAAVGTPVSPAATLPLETGSAGVVTLPPRSEDGIGARFSTDTLQVAYESGSVAVPGVSASAFGSALRARLQIARGVQLDAFAGLLRRERVALRITPDGGRRYPLPSAVLAESERVTRWIWRDGAPFDEVRLLRGVDYVIESGGAGAPATLVLARALWPDDAGGRIALEVEYTPEAAVRDAFAHGVGVAWAANGWSVAGGYAALPTDDAVAATYGATAGYRDARVRVEAGIEQRPGEDAPRLRVEGRLTRLPIAGGEVSGSATWETGFASRFTVQTSGRWPGGVEVEADAVGGRDLPLTGRFTARVRLDPVTLSLGHVQRSDRRATEVALLRRWGGFSLGIAAEVRWLDPLWTLIGRAGYQAGPWTTQLEHRAPLSEGESPTTTLTGEADVSDTLLRWRLEQVWGEDPATAALLAAEREVWGARVKAEWVVPLDRVEPSRLRLGLDAPIALADGWSVDVQAGVDRPLGEGATTASLGVAVNHASPGVEASVAVDGVLREDDPTLTLSARARTAALPADPRHALSVDARVDLLPTPDGRFALGYAFHDAAWSLLARQELRFGEGAGLAGEVNAAVAAGVVRFRPGVAYRIAFDDPDANAAQVGVGVAFHPASRLLVGVAGYYVWQPGLDAAAGALGAEIGVEIAPGTYLVFGYTIGDGPGLIAGSAPGFNVRLDVVGGTP